MPTTPGTYVLRFYTGSTLLATSATITVAMPSTTLTVNTTTVVAGRRGHGDGGQRTRRRARTGSPSIRKGSSTYVDWKYLNGTQTAPATGMTNARWILPMPTDAGQLHLRLYTGST